MTLREIDKDVLDWAIEGEWWRFLFKIAVVMTVETGILYGLVFITNALLLAIRR